MVYKLFKLLQYLRIGLSYSLNWVTLMLTVDDALWAYRWTLASKAKVGNCLIRMVRARNGLQACLNMPQLHIRSIYTWSIRFMILIVGRISSRVPCVLQLHIDPACIGNLALCVISSLAVWLSELSSKVLDTWELIALGWRPSSASILSEILMLKALIIRW